MLHEKPNNNIYWKNKLEDLESLPGETFNKEAAWEKLHERTRESRNTKAIWYWVAAASLLLALIIPWVFLADKKESVVVKNNSGQKQIQPDSHLSLPGKRDTTAVVSSLATEKKLPALSVEKGNRIKFQAKHKITPVEAFVDKSEKDKYMAQEITNNALVPVDTAIDIIAITPAKRNLKVVHINELGDPVAELPNTARYSEHHTFQLKLINQEVYTSSLPSAGNTGFNFFKTKNIPSN